VGPVQTPIRLPRPRLGLMRERERDGPWRRGLFTTRGPDVAARGSSRCSGLKRTAIKCAKAASSHQQKTWLKKLHSLKSHRGNLILSCIAMVQILTKASRFMRGNTNKSLQIIM
jgi:hypothetical protein